MMKRELLRVTEIDGQTLLGKLNFIETEIVDLRKEIKPKEPTVLMSRKQVAEMFGVTVNTIDEWRKQNILTAYKVQNRVFYKRNEVESILVKIKNPMTNE